MAVERRFNLAPKPLTQVEAKKMVSAAENAIWERWISPDRSGESFVDRRSYIEKRGWYILTKETADTLAKFLKGKRVLEVAAGLGYTAANMRRRGVKYYHAVDNKTKCFPDASHKLNYGFEERNAFSVTVSKYDCIVMTWPNYSSNLAEVIAKRMRKGQILIYQGEGDYGCTGTDKFHDYLDIGDRFCRLSNVEVELNQCHVNWWGMRDQWFVYQKLVHR